MGLIANAPLVNTISACPSGGWPLNVFLTPDLEPFFGGTYFPPVPAHGRPSFADVVQSLGLTWEHDRERVLERGRGS